MTEVLIVGGGPAGAIAAMTLARAGVRVTVLDRAAFPRHKLCGDSVNPGAMALLGRHGLAGSVAARGLKIKGMLLTGPGRAAVRAIYPEGVLGCAIGRRELDALLLDAAALAGVQVEQETRVVAPVTEVVAGRTRVSGVHVRRAGKASARIARVVIAADGRRSSLAFSLGLARHPGRPRRWAIGAYFEGVTGLSDVGEMHVRRPHYIGVAPVPGGLANGCLVVSERRAREIGPATAEALAHALRSDPFLGPRFARARRVTAVTTLGPLAVDVSSAGVEGLLLAGDAGGFVDPMTGDGLRIAMRSGELAAEAALEALAGAGEPHVRLARRHASELGTKLFVNRRLRSLVAVPAAVTLAAAASRLWPGLIGAVTNYAGDVRLADLTS